MPWGVECRSELIKQNPPKPTIPKQTKTIDIPGPSEYEPPPIVGGKGYSKIKRAPAYSFGLRTPAVIEKPAVLPRAPMVNIEYMSKKGYHKIPGGFMGEKDNPSLATKSPGPAAYLPQLTMGVKRPPAYSMAKPARPVYEPFDMWTPSPNMYCPPIPGKSDPAYSFGYTTRHLSRPAMPGPGDHEPKFDYVKKTKPAFSFGAPFREPPRSQTPAPNTYCEKKVGRCKDNLCRWGYIDNAKNQCECGASPQTMAHLLCCPACPNSCIREDLLTATDTAVQFKYVEQRGTAPSFGIRHTPYLGKQPEYLRSSKLDLVTAEP